MEQAKLEFQHPKYDMTLPRGDDIVVCFRVGYYVQPCKEAEEAYQRIRKALAQEQMRRDIAVIREWGGSVSLYSMSSKDVNPEITPEMQEEFRAAATKMYPEWVISDSWNNSSSGINGFSVLMRKRK